MKRHIFTLAFLLFVLLAAPLTSAHAQTEPPVVRAVLFYSPTCPHCEQVINETLPPLIQKYGDQLQIIGINVTETQGQTLFLAALDQFKLEQAGVPFLVIGDKYLMGSADIPEQLPGLIETYLTQGGVDFPDIPGLREAMAMTEDPAQQTAPTADSVSPDSPTPTNLTMQERFALDKSGNTLAVIVLAGMIGAVLWTTLQFQQKKKKTKTDAAKNNRDWIIPALCVVGFGVAGYLAYVETAQVAAVCGPVGDCNTVQQSEYARLFGILPVGVMGLAGYVGIMAAWLTARYTKGKFVDLANLSMFGMAVFGVLFSIYLTFLEPFVIGATCAWCLTSAILITILMLLSIRPAKAAFHKLGQTSIFSS
jgi:thiol-disulfide isomerase/thioredoxin